MKLFCKVVMCALLVSVLASNTVAKVKSAPDAIEQLKLKLDEIQTLTGLFEQTIKDNKGTALQESKGQFSLKRPGYFLWVSQEPFSQTVIGTPDSLKMYDPDLEQLTTYPRGTSDQNNPAHLLSGDLSTLRSAFVVEILAAKVDQPKYSVFLLKPIEADTPYKEITFRFDDKGLTSLTFLDKLDQITDIVFSGLQLNKPMQSTDFDFVAPEGTDIINND